MTILDIVFEAREIQVFLAFELRVKARFVDASGLFQRMNTGVRKSMFPKDGHRLFQKAGSTELFRSTHVVFRSTHVASVPISQIGAASKIGKIIFAKEMCVCFEPNSSKQHQNE